MSPAEMSSFLAAFPLCAITCVRSESADRAGGVNVGSSFVLLQRFVRAEGRANEAFWVCNGKLLPSKLQRDVLPSQGGAGEEGASGQVKVF